MAFRNAIAWSVFGQAFCYLILFAGSVVVARLLTPHEMGVFAIAMATIGILNTLLGFNVGAYVVREHNLQASTLETAFTINAILATLSGAVILVFSIIERRLLGNADVSKVLLPLSFVPVIGIFDFLPSQMLRREMNFKTIAMLDTGKSLITTSIVVTLAFAGFSYMSLAYGNLVAAIIGAIATNLVAGKHRRFRFSLRHGRAITIFGLRMMSIGGVSNIAQRLSDIVLGQMLGLSALGLYSRASSISSLIFDNIYGAVTRVVFVRLSEEARMKRPVRDIFLLSFDVITAALWPLQLGLAVLSGPAIFYLYGERWLGAALPLSVLMVAQCVVLCFGMSWELFVVKDETARQTRLEVIRAIVGTIFFMIGCLFNLTAAAVGRIAEALAGLVLYRSHVQRLSEAAPGQISRIVMNNACLTIGAVLPSFVLMLSTGWSHTTSPAMLVGAIFSGMLIWIAVLARQRHPLYTELQNLIAKISP
jgi:O-antigen/teichoic acid export membrane protein